MSIPKNVDVCVAPPFVYLPLVKSSLSSSFLIAAQNASTGTGAYTGEIAPSQLKDVGIDWTILGHSERRQLFGANDSTVNKQVKAALEAGLNVIACCGETLEERKQGETMKVVKRQLEAIGEAVGSLESEWKRIVIAYEPVWAIGTGQTATAQQAQEVHKDIRQWMKEKYSESIAETVRIIYGGSANAKNVDELLRESDIDGFLVGGASLKGEEFATIITAHDRVRRSSL